MPDQIYCGNNLYELGGSRLGSPYECLKKGIGRGLHLDLIDFNPNYRPIIADNIYCGKNNPPIGKILGSPTACLRKGVGIGKKIQYDRRGLIPPPIQSHQSSNLPHNQLDPTPPSQPPSQPPSSRPPWVHIYPPSIKSQPPSSRPPWLYIYPPAEGSASEASLSNSSRSGRSLGTNEVTYNFPRPSRNQNIFGRLSFVKKWWPLILAVLVGVIAFLFKATMTNILLSVILTLITCWIIKTILDTEF